LNFYKHHVFLSTGSNQGNSYGTLIKCNTLIETYIGKIKKYSPIYTTKAWGNTQQPDFLNQVLWVKTPFSPIWVFYKLQMIEKQLGRVRKEKWGPRIIDIDILFYDALILKNHELQIPHPQIQHRNFVLKPLLDIAPTWIHPELGSNIHTLWNRRTDLLEVKQYT
jgi:2-amino-4-hydroxy-6-hydroxymethyldihydropteridine diphosphokinase